MLPLLLMVHASDNIVHIVFLLVSCWCFLFAQGRILGYFLPFCLHKVTKVGLPR
jgi:MFS-type transporter involved in bile tolerance (Atg22 family)